MTKPALLASALLSLACACGKDDEAAPPPGQAAPNQPAAAQLLAVGAPAPALSAVAHDGSTVDLAGQKGFPVVVYFYPKDDTPGCTAEAAAFNEDLTDLIALGTRVVGVSMDSIESHKAFAAEHGIGFPLLADPGGTIAASFGVSTKTGHADRVTFLIGPDGNIARVFPAVRVEGHADEVMAAVRALAKK
jgi:peroxiredoxin Q/BCP